MKLNKTLLPLFLCGLVVLPVGLPFHTLTLAQAAENTGADAQPVPDAAKYEGPPLRDGNKVLFRFRAPSGTVKVFLAGSFNKFANNKNGKVTDDQFAMTEAKNGMFYQHLTVEAKEQKYKYVLIDAEGKSKWVADPQVKQTDPGGNTVLDFSSLRTVAEEKALLEVVKTDGKPLRDGDRVLFRFHAPSQTNKVLLAGSFNKWADNRSGVVTDQQYLMTSVGDNRWFKWVLVEPNSEKYKFVVVGEDGKARWVADPQAANVDNRGNTILNFDEIEPLKKP